MLPQFSDDQTLCPTRALDYNSDCTNRKQMEMEEKSVITKTVDDMLDQIVVKTSSLKSGLSSTPTAIDNPRFTNVKVVSPRYLKTAHRAEAKVIEIRPEITMSETIKSSNPKVSRGSKCPLIVKNVTDCTSRTISFDNKSSGLKGARGSKWPPIVEKVTDCPSRVISFDNNLMEVLNSMEGNELLRAIGKPSENGIANREQLGPQKFPDSFRCPNVGCDKVFDVRIARFSHLRVCPKNPPGIEKKKAHRLRNSFYCLHTGCTKTFHSKTAFYLHMRKCSKKLGLETGRSHAQTSVQAEEDIPTLITKETPEGLLYQCPYEGCSKLFNSIKGCRVHFRFCRGRFPKKSLAFNRVVEQPDVNEPLGSETMKYKCPYEGCSKHFSSLKGCRIHSSACKERPSEKKETKTEAASVRFEPSAPRKAALKAKSSLKELVGSMNYKNWKVIEKFREDYICKDRELVQAVRSRKPKIPDLRSASPEILDQWSKEIREKGAVRCSLENCTKAFDNEVEMLNHWKRCGLREPAPRSSTWRWQDLYRQRQLRKRVKESPRRHSIKKRTGRESELRKLLQMPPVSSWVPAGQAFIKKLEYAGESFRPNVQFCNRDEDQMVFVDNYPTEASFQENEDEVYEPLPLECILNPYVKSEQSDCSEEYLLPDENPKRFDDGMEDNCDAKDASKSSWKAFQPKGVQIKEEIGE